MATKLLLANLYKIGNTSNDELESMIKSTEENLRSILDNLLPDNPYRSPAAKPLSVNQSMEGFIKEIGHNNES